MGMMLSGAGGLVFKGTVRPDRAAPLLDDDAGFLRKATPSGDEEALDNSDAADGRGGDDVFGDRIGSEPDRERPSECGLDE